MHLEQHRKDWEEMSRLDPLWAILTDPQKRNGKWDPEEFFQTGVDEIHDLLLGLGGAGIEYRTNRALDFGCGAGRLTQALADRFDEVIGVDISQGMLDLAQRYNRHGDRCRFLLNATDALPDVRNESVDFIYTNIVLQHLPEPAMILRYLEEFVRILRPGGLAIFQLPREGKGVGNLHLKPRLWRLFRNVGVPAKALYSVGLHPILMNTVSEDEVRRFCEKSGSRLLRAERLEKDGIFSNVYTLRKGG
jgi:ubiquinone/menaquinone biosynthesis C-methylase UbiE